MQCLQYVLYFIIYSHYEKRAYVKGYHINNQTPKILPCRDRTPSFEIPASAPDLRLKPLCVEFKLSPKMNGNRHIK